MMMYTDCRPDSRVDPGTRFWDRISILGTPTLLDSQYTHTIKITSLMESSMLKQSDYTENRVLYVDVVLDITIVYAVGNKTMGSSESVTTRLGVMKRRILCTTAKYSY